jgi:hypothetical protein
MDFTVSSLMAGVIFGGYGLVVLKTAMRDANFPAAGLGAVLLLYTYFVANPWLCWGIGITLSVMAFRALKSGG